MSVYRCVYRYRRSIQLAVGAHARTAAYPLTDTCANWPHPREFVLCAESSRYTGVARVYGVRGCHVRSSMCVSCATAPATWPPRLTRRWVRQRVAQRLIGTKSGARERYQPLKTRTVVTGARTLAIPVCSPRPVARPATQGFYFAFRSSDVPSDTSLPRHSPFLLISPQETIRSARAMSRAAAAAPPAAAQATAALLLIPTHPHQMR